MSEQRTIRVRPADVRALLAAANAIESLKADEPGCGCATCEVHARIPKRLRRLARQATRPSSSPSAPPPERER